MANVRSDRPVYEFTAAVEEAIQKPELIPDLLAGLRADTARVKYDSGKLLRAVAERRPDLLMPHFDQFVRLLDHSNKLMQWEAIFILSHLVRVDAGRRFEPVFDRYFAPIAGPVMITAANLILGGARIAAAVPAWGDRISREILKVAHARYRTPECRKIAIGHAILALDSFIDALRDPRPVVRFVKRQLVNTRPATRAKAKRFLERHARITGASTSRRPPPPRRRGRKRARTPARG